jgi:DNA-binding beta-propeller fold protein YncE
MRPMARAGLVGLAVATALSVSATAGASTHAHSPVITKVRSFTVAEGVRPVQVAVDSKRHLAYIADADEETTTVVGTRVGRPVTLPIASWTPTGTGIAIDERTGYAYLPNGSSVAVLHGRKLIRNIYLGVHGDPSQILLDTRTHLVYAVNFATNTVSVIKGSTVIALIPLDGLPIGYGETPGQGAVNPRTGLFYLPERGVGVDVIRGTKVVTTIPTGSGPTAVAVDPTRNLAYVTNNGFIDDFPSSVFVISGDSHTTRQVPITNVNSAEVREPGGLIVNPKTHLVYVSDSNPAGVSVLDGARLVRTINGGPLANIPVAVDPTNGLVLLPTDHSIRVVRGTKIIQTLPLRANSGGYYAGIDTRNGRAVITSNSQGRILLMQTPRPPKSSRPDTKATARRAHT